MDELGGSCSEDFILIVEKSSSFGVHLNGSQTVCNDEKRAG
jgi:hypothetical protein